MLESAILHPHWPHFFVPVFLFFNIAVAHSLSLNNLDIGQRSMNSTKVQCVSLPGNRKAPIRVKGFPYYVDMIKHKLPSLAYF